MHGMGMSPQIMGGGSGMGGDTETLTFIISAVNMATPGIAAVGAGFANLTAIGMRTAASLNASLSTAQGAILAFGGVSALAFGKAIVDATEYERQLKSVQAVSAGMTDAHLQELSGDIKALAIKYGESASEVASAFTIIGRAGLEDATAQVRLFESALKMAKIEGMDLATAIEILMETTNMWSEAGMGDPEGFASEAEYVTEQMVQAAQMSTATVEDLFQGMKFVGGMARQIGWTVEETFGTIAYMKSVGIPGTMAGTALRGLMTKASAMDSGFLEAMNQLGLEDRALWRMDEQGKAVAAHDPATMLKIIHEAMTREGVDQQEVLAIWSKLGQQKTAQQLIKMDPQELDEFLAKMEESFDLQERVDIAMDSLGAQFDRFKSALQVLGITIGETILPVLKLLVSFLAEVTRVVGESKVAAWALTGVLGSAAIAAAAFVSKWALAGLKSGVKALWDGVTAVKTLGGALAGTKGALTATEIKQLALGATTMDQQKAMAVAVQKHTASIMAQRSAVDSVTAAWRTNMLAQKMAQGMSKGMATRGPLTAKDFLMESRMLRGAKGLGPTSFKEVTKEIMRLGSESDKLASKSDKLAQGSLILGAKKGFFRPEELTRSLYDKGALHDVLQMKSIEVKNLAKTDVGRKYLVNEIKNISTERRQMLSREFAETATEMKRQSTRLGAKAGEGLNVLEMHRVPKTTALHRLFGFTGEDIADLGSKKKILAAAFHPSRSHIPGAAKSMEKFKFATAGAKMKLKGLGMAMTTTSGILIIITALVIGLALAFQRKSKRIEEATARTEESINAFEKQRDKVEKLREEAEKVPDDITIKVELEGAEKALGELERAKAAATMKEMEEKAGWFSWYSASFREESRRNWGEDAFRGNWLAAGGPGMAMGRKTLGHHIPTPTDRYPSAFDERDDIRIQQQAVLDPYANWFAEIFDAKRRLALNEELSAERKAELMSMAEQDMEKVVKHVADMMGWTEEEARHALEYYAHRQYTNKLLEMQEELRFERLRLHLTKLWMVIEFVGKAIWEFFSVLLGFGPTFDHVTESSKHAQDGIHETDKAQFEHMENERARAIEHMVRIEQFRDNIEWLTLQIDVWVATVAHGTEKIRMLLDHMLDVRNIFDPWSIVDDLQTTPAFWDLQKKQARLSNWTRRTEDEIRQTIQGRAFGGLYGDNPLYGNYLASGLGGGATSAGQGTSPGDADGLSGRERLLKDGYNIDFILCSKKKLPDLDPNAFKKKPLFDIHEKIIDIGNVNINTRDRPEDIESSIRTSFKHIAESERID